MSESVCTLKSYRKEDFLSDHNLQLADETVAEVFGMMLSFPTTVVATPTPAPDVRVTKTAIVGYSGALRGTCEVRMLSEAARAIASAMLGGTPIAEDDDSIGDALGEICNMLAGGWKNRIPTLACLCSLSPPTVISGCDYKVQMGTTSLVVLRHYAFDVHTFSVSLRCEEPAG